jgi:uncharacterized protein (DUF2141 family)
VPSFLPPVTSPGLFSGTVGDFNNDGRADLISSDGYLGTVGVRLGNGDGTFQAARSSAAGRYPVSLVPGDFNGDGRLDVVSLGLAADVNLLLGNGDGTFQAPRFVPLPPAGGARSVVAGDLNGDGKLDLVAGLELDGAMHSHHSADGYSFGTDYVSVEYTVFASVLLGHGDGSFAATSTNLVGKGEHTTILPRGGPIGYVLFAPGDFDGDGRQDVLAGGLLLYGQTKLLRGHGDGTLAAPQSATDFARLVGDFNGDGKADLVTANGVRLGNGDGTFRTAQTFPASTAVGAVGDFNGDGKLDVVTSNSATGTVSVLLGTGTGTLQPARTFAAGPSPSTVAVGDFNGDGGLDLAVTGPSGLSVLLNDRHW